MTTAVTGVPSPEPPDPPDPPDLTLSFTIPSPPLCFFVLTISDLHQKIETFEEIDLSIQISKEISLPKDFGLMILIVVFVQLLTAICRSFLITSYLSLTQFHSVLSHRSLPFTLHDVVSLCWLTPLCAAIPRRVKDPETRPSLTFTTPPTAISRSPALPEPLILLPDTSLQVIDLKPSVYTLLALMLSVECSLVRCYGTNPAFVQLFTAVCRFYSGLTPANDSLTLFSHCLWQIRKETHVVSIFSMFLDCLSFAKYVCLPYLPFGLSGCVAGSSVSKITYALMFVLLKGSSIWCIVASLCDAKLLIVKPAYVAASISGTRPLLMLSNSQSFISLLSTIGVEFRGLLDDFKCLLCVMFAPILWCCILLLSFAIVATDVLAGLALLLLHVNNFSYHGD